MIRNVKLAVSSLNLSALDFEFNYNNIIESIEQSIQQNAIYRIGPELEITGYSCEDHFLESDTIYHSWQIIERVLQKQYKDIIIDLGMPVEYNGAIYNCRIIIYNSEIVLIRPKKYLANDGNYRETRWFTAWKQQEIVQYRLPDQIQKVNKQQYCPMGIAVLDVDGVKIGIEMCEELWVSQPVHIEYLLDGVDIVTNASASHFQIDKTKYKLQLMQQATIKNGGVYLYTNLNGCDGNRLLFDGLSLIWENGNIIGCTQQFSYSDVQVATAEIDVNQIRNKRIADKSYGNLSQSKQNRIPLIQINLKMQETMEIKPANKVIRINEIVMDQNQELAESTANYLWDYLRKSKSSGYFLPLSGGADSAASALCVYYMCKQLYHYIQNDNKLLNQLRKIVQINDFIPKSIQDIAKQIFSTAYLESKNSSNDTKIRSANLSSELGSYHLQLNIQKTVDSIQNEVSSALSYQLNFQVHGGTYTQDLALQNIIARSRMVISYMLAQIIPEKQGKKGFLLVLGSSNHCEALRGYLTKYDCSSADINPIGSLSKRDLKKILEFFYEKIKIISVEDIINANPSAELRPGTQVSENEMGLSFEEYEQMAIHRKELRQGPLSMFIALSAKWKANTRHLLNGVAEKVKHFYRSYANNRHKMTTITPSPHLHPYNCDDNRHDLRPFLYNSNFDIQFSQIDKLTQQ